MHTNGSHQFVFPDVNKWKDTLVGRLIGESASSQHVLDRYDACLRSYHTLTLKNAPAFFKALFRTFLFLQGVWEGCLSKNMCTWDVIAHESWFSIAKSIDDLDRGELIENLSERRERRESNKRIQERNERIQERIESRQMGGHPQARLP